MNQTHINLIFATALIGTSIYFYRKQKKTIELLDRLASAVFNALEYMEQQEIDEAFEDIVDRLDD